MPDLRRVTVLAIVLLVAARVAIGWQFLYEGLWKVRSFETSRPWSAEGYLKNAQGPFRGFFRNLAGDPDELDWLDYDAVAARWDAWQQRFADHYDLSDEQRKHLAEMIDGPETISAELTHWPAGVKVPGPLAKIHTFDWGGREKRMGLWFDEGRDKNDVNDNRLVVDAKILMLPEERASLK
ncbi:MAG: hypothetical protein KY476_26290, partial [Planctomycetes bacterium]|nr:hypothetical protein [Planctomycetota bacterium]